MGWGGSYYLPDTIEFIGDGAMEYCSIYGHYKKVFIDYVMAEEMRSWWYYPSRDEIKKLLPPLVKKFHKEGMKKIAEYKKSIADGKDLIKNSKRELKEIQPICNETYKLYTETTGFFKRKKQAEYWEKYCELNRRITDLKSKINVTSDMDKWYHEQLEEMEAIDMSYYEGKALEHLVHREQERVEPMHDTYLYKNKGRPRGFFADEIRDAMNAASAPKTQPATEIIVMPKIDTTDM